MTDSVSNSIAAALDELESANRLMHDALRKIGMAESTAHNPADTMCREPLEASIRLAGNAETCLRRFRENICLVAQLRSATGPVLAVDNEPTPPPPHTGFEPTPEPPQSAA